MTPREKGTALSKRVLLTGAGGFVGHHILEHILASTSWDVVATDSFRHKGKTDRIRQVVDGNPHWAPRVHVVTHDLAAPFSEQTAYLMGPLDYVIAAASESHVDRSIADPVPFCINNHAVALHTLEFCRLANPQAVIWVSTDEVYGPEPVTATGPAPHREWAPIIPSNPYAASKAAQEALVISYWRTYGVPAVIINAMNLIGERQDKEKFLPMLIRGIASGQAMTIHGRPGDIGTRHYLHARNLADGIVFLLQQGIPAVFGAHAVAIETRAARNASAQASFAQPQHVADRPDRYNIVGPDRVSNLELAQMVAGLVGRPLRYELVDFHSARPGHDPHYGLDPAKMTAAGWKPPVPLQESLARTVRWSLAHPQWLD